MRFQGSTKTQKHSAPLREALGLKEHDTNGGTLVRTGAKSWHMTFITLEPQAVSMNLTWIPEHLRMNSRGSASQYSS